MYTLVYEYEVDAADVARFELTYGPDGPWAQMFRQAAGYLGSTLSRDVSAAGRYVLLDRWRDEGSFEGFMAEFGTDYQRFSDETRDYYRRETKLGALT